MKYNRRNSQGRFIRYTYTLEYIVVGFLILVAYGNIFIDLEEMFGVTLLYTAEASVVLKEAPAEVEIYNVDIPHEYLEEMVHLADKYDVPIEKMAKIIRAESNWVMSAENINRNGTIDRHLCQINDYYWLESITKAGFEWHDLEACFWIYSLEGDRPWVHSRHVWGS